MRRLIPCFAIALVSVSCHFSGPGRDQAPAALPELAPHPSPYTQVSEGVVHALIPERWTEAPLPGASYREGLVASPDLRGWNRQDGSVPGLEVAWVDGTRLQIPSDYYYLAANGPAIPHVASSHRCDPSYSRVIVDHRPDFGSINRSPSDYVASGAGTCRHQGHLNRWAYFVAAPGFGPLRRIGIPSSGLYTAFAVLPDGPRAGDELRRLLTSAMFGAATVGQLVLAAREAARKS